MLTTRRQPGWATRIPAPRRGEWPSVCVVIATRNRPNLLRRALRSVLAQDYAGPVLVMLVFDGVRPDSDLATAGERPVFAIRNRRTPGPAGARNTGILAAEGCDLVALCQDDDTWAPTKLTTQVAALDAGRTIATCAMEVEYGGRRTPRLTGLRDVGPERLTPAVAWALPPSGVLARRRALLTPVTAGGVGLLDEAAPERIATWDLLVRAVRRTPIRHVDRPLVRVLWREPDPASYLAHTRALCWMIARHPEIGTSSVAAAQIYAELACLQAAAGDRAAAWASVRAAARLRWYEPRLALAAAAASGVLRGVALRAALRWP